MVALELVDAVLIALLLGTAILFENKVGIRKRIMLLWAKLVNAETDFKVTASYTTDLPLENLQEEIKSVLREQYTLVDVFKEDDDAMTLEIEDTFLVTLRQEDDCITVETSRITATMRLLQQQITEFFTVLAAFEERNQHQTGDEHTFEDERFTIDLYLPFDMTFINVYLPRGAAIKHYELELDYPEYDCTIEEKNQALQISTAHRHDLSTIVSRILRARSVWWHRLT